MASYEDAKYLVTLIPGARLLTVESGGHLLLGHRDEIDQKIRAFLWKTVRGRAEEAPQRIRP